MRLSVFAVASVLSVGVLPTVSFAQTAVPAQTGDVAQPANTDLDQVVCRKSPPPVGTRLGGGRECHTQREWNDRQAQAQKQLQTMQGGAIGRLPGG
jgi:hypothetical protein